MLQFTSDCALSNYKIGCSFGTSGTYSYFKEFIYAYDTTYDYFYYIVQSSTASSTIGFLKQKYTASTYTHYETIYYTYSTGSATKACYGIYTSSSELNYLATVMYYSTYDFYYTVINFSTGTITLTTLSLYH